MSREQILIVDDEPQFLELLKRTLQAEGYQISCANSGAQYLQEVKTNPPDLVLLDIMLPDMDGFQILAAMGMSDLIAQIPVIILSAKDKPEDVVRGLELGADDYIVKPFDRKILAARVASVLRRRRATSTNGLQESAPVQYGELAIDPVRHEVMLGKQQLNLTLTEFKLLYAMTRRPGAVFTRSQLILIARGAESDISSRAIDVQLVTLRRKLGEYADFVETVRGIGYRVKDLSLEENLGDLARSS